MKVQNGCAICGSTWGNYWEEIEGQKMFFCCDLCAVQFRNMIEKVKRKTGWDRIDEIKISGDYRGRNCTALNDEGRALNFFIRFDSTGGIQNFSVLGS